MPSPNQIPAAYRTVMTEWAGRPLVDVCDANHDLADKIAAEIAALTGKSPEVCQIAANAFVWSPGAGPDYGLRGGSSIHSEAACALGQWVEAKTAQVEAA